MDNTSSTHSQYRKDQMGVSPSQGDLTKWLVINFAICIVLDIEGTTNPISFVHGILAEQDHIEGISEPKKVFLKKMKSNKPVIHNIEWQMKADRKIGPLKSFQGYM
ncbi:656_t:CDS:2 [Entrophospora sp. SA101]|nr:656_t:CDS:2 [Entrophospora sp. SA101]